MRVGVGYDIHRLVEGRPLYLGGIGIPYSKGLLGHSDGDVVLHAVSDALLGAAGLPDIGELFPDTDPVYRNFDSKKILLQSVELVHRAGFRIVSLDIVVICEMPKLLPYKAQIKEKIRSLIDYPCHLNLKAKTNEGLGVLGQGEAIACLAVALLGEQR
jgi:2-C-methyl-D-erythritol 2,4-cyclodiphosphate synthase